MRSSWCLTGVGYVEAQEQRTINEADGKKGV